MSFSRNIWWNLAYPQSINRVRLSAALTVICWHLRLGRRLGAFQIHTIRWRHSRPAPLTITVTISVALRNVSIVIHLHPIACSYTKDILEMVTLRQQLIWARGDGQNGQTRASWSGVVRFCPLIRRLILAMVVFRGHMISNTYYIDGLMQERCRVSNGLMPYLQ